MSIQLQQQILFKWYDLKVHWRFKLDLKESMFTIASENVRNQI